MRAFFLLIFFVSGCFNGTPRATASTSCEMMKSKLYAHSPMRIRVVFGYKDARPARFVGDRHERLAFIDRLTAPCEGGNYACGFERSRADADLFSKTAIIGGRPIEIQLEAVNSSVATDDDENRNDPFQVWKSQNAQRAFLDGFKEADIVFYNGHSRFGGGPDFRPPHLAADGTVDPGYYKSVKTGIRRVVEALEEARAAKADRFAHLKVLGFYSCSSTQHFKTAIRRNTDAGYISSPQLMYYSDALNLSLDALNDLLTGRCPDSMSFD